VSIRSLTQEDPIGLAGGLNLYGFANGDPVNFSDPFGLCKRPAGLKNGQVGICIETFIAGPSRGVPRWAADNRTFSSSGGTYKTTDRFIVDPASGSVSRGGGDVGNTGRLPGIGVVAHSDGTRAGNTTIVGAIADARTLSPWPPFNINYALAIEVDGDGNVSVFGSHDGYPSYEVWVYRDGQDPKLVYKHQEGHVGQLAGSRDVKINP
jgi:hypothetical protein